MYILKIRFPFMAFYFCADFRIVMRADIYLTIRFTEFDFGAGIRTFVFIMRPCSLGGASYCVALCLSVCLSVRLSVCLSVRPVIVAIGNVFSSTASGTDVLFGTH